MFCYECKHNVENNGILLGCVKNLNCNTLYDGGLQDVVCHKFSPSKDDKKYYVFFRNSVIK